MVKANMFSGISLILTVALVLLTSSGCKNNVSYKNDPRSGIQYSSWQLAKGTSGQPITTISIYRNNPDTIYALGNEVLRSKNGGFDWEPIVSSSTQIGDLVVDPYNNDHLYYASIIPDPWNMTDSPMYDLVISINGGKEWNTLEKEVIYPPVIQPEIRLDPMNSDTVYVYTALGYILRSSDKGQSWNSLSRPHGVSGKLSSLVIAPSNDHVIYLGYTSGIYKSTD